MNAMASATLGTFLLCALLISSSYGSGTMDHILMSREQAVELSKNSILVDRLEQRDPVHSNSRETLFVSEKLNEQYMPSIGNGYMATQALSDTVYVSGFFNGMNYTTPSHRARIPAYNNLRISNTSSSEWAFAYQFLDVEIGVHGIVYKLLPHLDEKMTVTSYMHKTMRNIWVVDIRFEGKTSACAALSRDPGSKSSDILFSTISDVQVIGTINIPEIPGGNLVQVSVLWDDIPEQVCSDNATSYQYLAAIGTSLESDDMIVYTKKAMASAKAVSADELRNLHSSAWSTMWETGRIHVNGDMKLAQAIYGSMYYILSSTRPDWPYGLSPGGLASDGYNGHTFWDQETWMYPPLLLLHNDYADAALQYRIARRDQAMDKATRFGYAGTMFPWESAFTGTEVCAPEERIYEQHINGDIGFAVKQYWMMTHDVDWMELYGYPLLEGISEFWASRVVQSTYNASAYSINEVQPPDEYHWPVNDSVYTNIVAGETLRFADWVRMNIINDTTPGNWTYIADRLTVLENSTYTYHPEFRGYDVGTTIKQADVVLLGFPLTFRESTTERRNDLLIYNSVTSTSGPAMTWAMFAIGWLELQEYDLAMPLFDRGYANVQSPFQVWTETPGGGCVNFITGAGGFLQSVLFGLSGMRMDMDKITFFGSKVLPANVTDVTITGLDYQGSSLEVKVTSSSISLQCLSRTPGSPLLSAEADGSGRVYPLNVLSPPVVLPAGVSIEVSPNGMSPAKHDVLRGNRPA